MRNFAAGQDAVPAPAASSATGSGTEAFTSGFGIGAYRNCPLCLTRVL
jgi:hypothetical protein